MKNKFPRIYILPIMGVVILTTFLVFYFSTSQILGTELVMENYLAFGLFGTLLGIIIGCILYFNMKVAALIFGLSYVAATYTMINTFLNRGAGGFNDPAGVLMFMIILAFGLIIGLFIEIPLFFIRRRKYK